MKDAYILKSKLKMPVFTYDMTDSTSTRAREYLRNNPDCENALFIANGQYNGRGRQGKSFYSPPGTGVYFSYICRDGPEIVCITSKAALAILDVLEAKCAVTLKIKWVNDIYLDNKKVCGILCEKVGEHIIIGVGINLTTESFPPDIAERAGSLNTDCDKADLISEIVTHLADLNTLDWYDAYKAKSLILGKQIRYTVNGISCEATAEDIDRGGELIVRSPDGTVSVLSSGEISVKL